MLGALTLLIQFNQPSWDLLAAHIRLCFQQLADDIGMGLKVGLPQFRGQLDRSHVMPPGLSIDEQLD